MRRRRGGGVVEGGRGERVGAFRTDAHLNIHRNICVHKGAERGCPGENQWSPPLLRVLNDRLGLVSGAY